MASDVDRAHVRLAELIAALSLGIDLGFGQPMEHVLRQSLIALRLAERVGLDEDERAVVYYTALLISVGCHSDAHADQQRGVVHDRPFVLVEADALGQAQRDQALSEHVLHRLPEPEIDPE